MMAPIRVRITSMVRRLWLEYCEENSISTIKHLIMEHLGPIDRGWWIIWISAALIMSVLSAIATYSNWVDNPIYISYEPGLKPIQAVPFPAITICALVQNRLELFNLTLAATRIHQNIDLENLEYRNLRALTHVCPFVASWISFHDKLSIPTVEILRNLSVDRETLINGCYWKTIDTNCSKMFFKTITDSGVCYTFNAMAAKTLYRLENLNQEFTYSETTRTSTDWFRESGDRSDSNFDVYPERPLGYGRKYGLEVGLVSNLNDDDLFCNGPRNGYKVLVHPPDEAPTLDHFHYRLGFRDTMLLFVKPQITKTSLSLESQSIIDRQCFFENERYLRFYKIYNQHT
ncbi:pickpocket protein 28-like [Uranotaenia lowii]|uniref:pickpocket protein 28-like n=1 Tax=Uranotaenia lowii TaxID=190385 RepID=UPI0024785872|nr:pickpocket protein 28-like [Uranotaenia lowii]